jgi:hypothetical protein
MPDGATDGPQARVESRRLRVRPNPIPRFVAFLECRGCGHELFEIWADTNGAQYLSLPGGIRVTHLDLTHQCGRRFQWSAKIVAPGMISGV